MTIPYLFIINSDIFFIIDTKIVTANFQHICSPACLFIHLNIIIQSKHESYS